jgi:hypothetical protein
VEPDYFRDPVPHTLEKDAGANLHDTLTALAITANFDTVERSLRRFDLRPRDGRRSGTVFGDQRLTMTLNQSLLS